jgi:hypothetical protein
VRIRFDGVAPRAKSNPPCLQPFGRDVRDLGEDNAGLGDLAEVCELREPGRERDRVWSCCRCPRIVATATTAPAPAIAAATSSPRWKPARTRPECVLPETSELAETCATIAPVIAIPSEPPTWRMLFSTAEPTPAWSRGTELIAAAVVGVIVNAMPTPITTRPGRISQ